jgi:formyltetrahydrofolate-dependent phosphoribosylglycinamide formyltransferase
MPLSVAVCSSGGGTNLQALLDGLSGESRVAIALVMSDRAGSGGLARAEQAGVESHVFQNPASGEEWLTALGKHRIDLVVLAGFLKLVPASVIEAYRGRIINIHPALLPAFGGPGMYGRRVHEAVLASGVRVSGCTVHLVDELYDHGEILAQRRVPVLPGDTVESLAARVLEAEHQLLPAVVVAAAQAGRPVPLPQPAESHS